MYIFNRNSERDTDVSAPLSLLFNLNNTGENAVARQLARLRRELKDVQFDQKKY